ncbi:hypothetical protein NUACC21_16290 [Scytonema sp. NUACC21]
MRLEQLTAQIHLLPKDWLTLIKFFPHIHRLSALSGDHEYETKNRALATVKALEMELELTHPVRIHWTGCPNSCGQPQVADIGLMGTKARKNGKAVEGVDIYMGGKVGKEAHLGSCIAKGIPCEDLLPVLRELMIEHFGARLREAATV